MKVCLLLPAPPGRVPADAAGCLARSLAGRAGVSVSLAVTGERPGEASVDAAIAEGGFDVALALHWTSTARLHEVLAARHALWVEAVAHHDIGIWNAERIAARLAYDLPLDFIAAGEAVAADLADLRPDARRPVARSGVDKALFAPGAPAEGPLRVVDAPARDAPAMARAEALGAADVAVVAGSDERAVLEAMHCGAVCIVTAEGVVRHAQNGLVADPEDGLGVARWLEHLDRDRAWLGALREAALATAAAWPSCDEAGEELERVLRELVAGPAPEAAGWPARLMASAMAGVALHRNDDVLLAAELERVQSDQAYVAATALRDWATDSPKLAGVRRVARPAVRAARRRLG